MTVKPKGVKNSAGGADPERSSPMIGDKRYRTNAGGSLSLKLGTDPSTHLVIFYIQGYVVHVCARASRCSLTG
jgi:hypothetical protein